ncbi:MAG: hypothetical protein J0L75_18720 [Spirochaetes bacterium]|nr:hypothetical protein [Spirochaetota bacterium]
MTEKKHPRFEPNLFREPTPDFRSIPFWSLNDELEPAEIRRQLAAFKEGGFGGAYLHSRIGLLTPYLGEDWWRAMDAGVEACDELGIEAWFYDEDKWPSGFAGGIVPRLDASYRARVLARLKKGAPVPEHGEVLGEDGAHQYVCWVQPLGEAWFNGTSWVDLFNPDCVKAFIDCSYKPYVERYRGRPSVRGIFTDEPQISPRSIPFPHEGVVSWSPFLRERFKKDHGFDVLSKAAELFEESGDFRRTRLLFYRSVAAQFEAAFTIPIATYCGENGFVWTGHYNGENNFRSVIGNVGSMASHYRHMQRPGMDWLGLHIDHGMLSAKTLSSVANQYGQPRRLSEMFGCSGQNMSAEDRAWIFGWHALLGVNHACPHLSLYTVRGVRKRDYPPTLSPQQPWWPFHRQVEDLMARVSYAVSAGSYAAEMLLLLPLESGMCEYPAKTMDERSAAFEQLMKDLTDANRDYDLGEETVLLENAKAEKGRLVVGEASYPMVLIPPMLSIRRSTVDLLGAFLDGGGLVAACAPLPDRVDGAPDGYAKEKLGSRIRFLDAARLPQALGECSPPAVAVAAKSPAGNALPVWTHLRKVENGRLCLAFNPSRRESAQVKLALRERPLSVLRFDTSHGTAEKLAVDASGAVAFTLAPAETAVLALDLDAKVEARTAAVSSDRVISVLDGHWACQRLDENALVLDFAFWKMEGKGQGEKAEPVIAIAELLTQKGWSGPLELSYPVDIAQVPARCLLAFECPNMDGEWKVNGKLVPLTGGQPFLDSCYTTVDVAALLKTGRNTISFRTDYRAPLPASLDAHERYGTEIETIFLIGDFAVEGKPSSEPPAPNQLETRKVFLPRKVHRLASYAIAAEKPATSGDLVPQGYPFYTGRFALERDFTLEAKAAGRTLLTFENPDVQAIQVEVNGGRVGVAILSPWEVDLTDAVKPGVNRLRLTIVNSLRNLLGPHHHRDGELTGVGPDSFTGRGTWTSGGPGDNDWAEKRKTGGAKIWRDDYHVIPFGLLTPPKLVVRG